MASYELGMAEGLKYSQALAQAGEERRYQRAQQQAAQIAHDQRQIVQDRQAQEAYNQNAQIKQATLEGLQQDRAAKLAIQNRGLDIKENAAEPDIERKNKILWHQNAIEHLDSYTPEQLEAEGRTEEQRQATRSRHIEMMSALGGRGGAGAKGLKQSDPLAQEKARLDIKTKEDALEAKEAKRKGYQVALEAAQIAFNDSDKIYREMSERFRKNPKDMSDIDKAELSAQTTDRLARASEVNKLKADGYAAGFFDKGLPADGKSQPEVKKPGTGLIRSKDGATIIDLSELGPRKSSPAPAKSAPSIDSIVPQQKRPDEAMRILKENRQGRLPKPLSPEQVKSLTDIVNEKYPANPTPQQPFSPSVSDEGPYSREQEGPYVPVYEEIYAETPVQRPSIRQASPFIRE
jgi:hypothetical protein